MILLWIIKQRSNITNLANAIKKSSGGETTWAIDSFTVVIGSPTKKDKVIS